MLDRFCDCLLSLSATSWELALIYTMHDFDFVVITTLLSHLAQLAELFM